VRLGRSGLIEELEHHALRESRTLVEHVVAAVSHDPQRSLRQLVEDFDRVLDAYFIAIPRP
jgi:hypothetical protein